MDIKKGFALLELLIVVIIIGIIATTVLMMLKNSNKQGEAGTTGSPEQQARKASGQATLSSIPAALALCRGMSGAINEPTTPGTSPICSESTAMAVWPTLPAGWEYGVLNSPASNNVSLTATCEASSCGADIIATCTMTGCAGF